MAWSDYWASYRIIGLYKGKSQVGNTNLKIQNIAQSELDHLHNEYSSSSDDDYVDIGEVTSHVDDDCNDEVVTSEKSGNGRGKDIEWVEIARFIEKAEYENSVTASKQSRSKAQGLGLEVVATGEYLFHCRSNTANIQAFT